MRQTPYEPPRPYDNCFVYEPISPPRVPKNALTYRRKPGLKRLPEDLPVDELTIIGCTNIEELPCGLRAGRVTIQDCAALRRLGDRTEIGTLRIERCPKFERLPDGLRCRELVVCECPALTALPARLEVGTLTARDSQIEIIPADIRVHTLDMSGARALKRVPPGFRAATLSIRRSPTLLRLPAEMHVKQADL